MEFSHYEEVPPENAKKIIEAAERERKEEED
jgi:translation elongation factor EF-G